MLHRIKADVRPNCPRGQVHNSCVYFGCRHKDVTWQLVRVSDTAVVLHLWSVVPFESMQVSIQSRKVSFQPRGGEREREREREEEGDSAQCPVPTSSGPSNAIEFLYMQNQ